MATNKEDAPLFSIIIPVYNVEKYLAECVESVLAQTYKNFEIILVDDGSKDSSNKICLQYVSKFPERINLIFEKSDKSGLIGNFGLSHARNFGVSHARGEYIIFLDSDDIWLDSRFLERIEKQILNNSKLECIAIESCTFFDKTSIENNSVIFSYPESLINPVVCLQGKDFLKVCLEKDSSYPWYAWMYVFKRSFWIENGFIFPEGRTYEDVYLIYKVLLKAKSMIVFPYIVYGYRIRRESITNTPSLKNLENFLYAIKSNINDLNTRKDIDSDLRRKLCNNFARGYFTVVIQSDLTEQQKELNQLLLKDKWIADYCINGYQNLCKRCLKVFGFHFVATFLHFRRKLKYGK